MRTRSRPTSVSMLAVFLMAGTLLSGSRPAGAGVAHRAVPADPWQLGTFTRTQGTVYDCPSHFSCFKFVVKDCPQVQDAEDGALAASYPSGPAKGVIVFFRGGSGADWWAFTPLSQQWMHNIRERDGFVLVQIKFTLGWTTAHNGVPTGPALLGCRPSTVVKYVHDQIYLPLGINPLPGQCGYCITGNSGGSSAVAYPLAYYGLDTILNGVVPTGGPDHAGITKACLLVPGYEFNDVHRQTIDDSYGYLDPSVNPGPCFLEDPSWSAIWDADSIDLGGNDYTYPDTRIEFIEGGLDDTGAVPHGRLYYDVLSPDPNNHVTWSFLPNMPHRIAESKAGLNALEKALLKTLG